MEILKAPQMFVYKVQNIEIKIFAYAKTAASLNLVLSAPRSNECQSIHRKGEE